MKNLILRIKEEKLETILIIILPAFLILSPFLSDLAVIIIVLVFLFKIYNKKNYSIFLNKNYIFFLIFILNSIIVTYYNFIQDINVSLKSATFYFRFGFFSLALAYFFCENKNLLKNLFIAMSLFFLILIFDSYLQFISGSNLLLFKRDVSGRISSFFGNELIMGSYVLRLLFIYISLFFFLKLQNLKYLNFLFGIITALCISIIFLSGERTSIFLLIFGLILLILLTNIKITKNFLFLFFFLISLIFLISSESSLKNRLYDRTLLEGGLDPQNKQSIILNTKEYKHFTQQISYFLTAYNIFESNPMGYGNRSYYSLCYKYRADRREKTSSCSTHPHNSYFQLLAENGAIGFILYFGFFIYIASKIFLEILEKLFSKKKLSKQKNILKQSRNIIYIAIIINLFPLAQTGNVFNNWLNILYFLPIGILIYYNKYETKQKLH